MCFYIAQLQSSVLSEDKMKDKSAESKFVQGKNPIADVT